MSAADLIAGIVLDKVTEATGAAYDEGFARGLVLGRQETPRPSGTCSLSCGGDLEWTGDPKPCGCRNCRCLKCGRDLVAACGPCEYAGL